MDCVNTDIVFFSVFLQNATVTIAHHCIYSLNRLLNSVWQLLKVGPGLFCLFTFFSHTDFTEITVGMSGIRTQLVKVDGKHADHLTNTTAQMFVIF